jgi:hypothetical protein
MVVTCRDCDEEFTTRRERATHECPERSCSLCDLVCQSRVSLEYHLKGRRHRNAQRVTWLAEQSVGMLDTFYQRALEAVATSEKPVDLDTCSPIQLKSFFKRINIGHHCLSCWKEFPSEDHVSEHLASIENEIKYAVTKEYSHIYPLNAIKAEQALVEEKMREDPIATVKIKVLFAIKAAMLVLVRGLQRRR